MENVACEQFLIFVNVGGSKGRCWGTAARQPSKLIFDRLFTKPFKDHGELTGMSIAERCAAAKKLTDRGHNRRVIAELLGVVPSTVRYDLLGPIARKAGINVSRVSKWLSARRAAVQELAAEGYSRREMAGLLGIDKQKVSRDLRLAHVAVPTRETKGRYRASDGQYRRTALGDLRLPEVRRLAGAGHSAREIAAIVGVNRRTVHEDLKRLGGWRGIRQRARADSFPLSEETASR